MYYNTVGKRNLSENILNSYKSQEELDIESITKAEQADQILKGKTALPVGTRRTWNNKEYVKTAQGWKSSKDVKDAHDKIHKIKEKEEDKDEANKEDK